jgi:hypothetical protein
MDHWDGTALDDRRPLCIVQSRWLAWRFTVNETVRTACVELQHPVVDDLQRHATDRGRFRAPSTVIDGGQGQKSERLSGILALPGLGAQPGGILIAPQRCGHGEPLSFASPRMRTHSRRSSSLSRPRRELVLVVKI